MKVLAWPLLNSTNSFTEQLYSALSQFGVEVEPFSVKRVLFGRPDIVHIHWPEYQLSFRRPEIAATRSLLLFLLLYFSRSKGAKVVWTVHNFRTHNGQHPKLEALFWRLLLRFLDGVIYLSDTSRKEAICRHRKLDKISNSTIAHGHYCVMNANSPSKLEARHRLSIPPGAVVAACFGMIRPTKNVPQVIERFREIDNESYRLVIAGLPNDKRLKEELIGAVGRDHRIVAKLDFVDDSEIPVWLNAADFCVINYSRILNSGSALLSLSFRRPLFVSNLPYFRYLQDHFGSDWIRTFSDGLPADQFELAFQWALDEKSSIDEKLEQISWPRIAEQTLHFYRRLRDAR